MIRYRLAESRTSRRLAVRSAPAVLVVTLIVGGVAAAQEETYRVEYRASRAALDAGDTEGAAKHARAAWQAAEETLGEDSQTGILAYNYAKLAVFSDSAGARSALRRVNELRKAGRGQFRDEELELYSAYAEFAAELYGRRRAERLRERLEAWGADRDLGVDVVVMWLNLGQAYIGAKQYRQAQESAQRAEAAILSSQPDNYNFHASAVLINGLAGLLTDPRSVRRVQAAHREFSRARRLFPPQKDLDNFHPLLARIIAWDGAAKAALRSLGLENFPDRDDPDYVAQARSPLFAHEQDASCSKLEWIDRRPPDFPRKELNSGMIGAVYVGFALGDDRRVRDARVLAEIPQARFSEKALESMSAWLAKEVPPGNPLCYRNLVTLFTFVID